MIATSWASWRRRLPPLAAAAVAVFASPVAQAHLVQTGFGAFYDGAAHVLATTADLLVLIAVALLAGVRSTRSLPGARWALLLLPVAWGAGVVGGGLAGLATMPALATTLSFAMVGALVAWNPMLPAPALALVGGAAGLLHGLSQSVAIGRLATEPLYVAGTLGAVTIASTAIAAAAVALEPAWTRIAIRALGSWLAAIGILMLGWLAIA